MLKRTLLDGFLKKFGEGGMEVVYKAEDIKLESTVAIKFLPRHIAVNSKERERFLTNYQHCCSYSFILFTSLSD